MAPKQGALAFTDAVPDWVKHDSARGSEEVGSKDLILPRLEIVQPLSPIRDEDPDALEGHMFNSATHEVLGESAIIVPIYFRTEYIVWKDKDSGGGFFGSFLSEGEAVQRMRKAVLQEGEQEELLEVVDTPVHYCLRVRDDGSTEQIVISMAKSKAKVSRKWNSVIQMGGGDRFSRAYRVGTFKDKNKKNQTFFNFTVMPVGFCPKALFDEAERTYKLFKDSNVQADHASAGGESNNGHADRGEI